MLTNEELMAINGYSEDDLEHYGILGMKWGIRRYENPDGSLTEAGKRRYAKYERKKQRVMQSGDAKKILKFRKNLTDEEFDTAMARVAKTDALRYNANAAKRDKQEAKAAEKAEKKQAKLTKKQMANAKKIAEQNAKQSVKSRDFVSTITRAAAITGTIYTLYKNVSGIANAAGIDISPANVTKLFKKKEDKTLGGAIDISVLEKNTQKAFEDASDISKTIASRQKPQQTSKTVWNMSAASDPRVGLNTKSVNSFFNTVNNAKASQNTDRVNSFFDNLKSTSVKQAKESKDRAESPRRRSSYFFGDVEPTSTKPKDGSDRIIDGFGTTVKQAKEARDRWESSRQATNYARVNNFFDNLSSGQKTTSSILSGTVEGTGNSFKSLPYNSLSNLPRETFVKTDNFINAYKSQPILLDYDRSK